LGKYRDFGIQGDFGEKTKNRHLSQSLRKFLIDPKIKILPIHKVKMLFSDFETRGNSGGSASK
jgi:hypothetical protein